MKKMYGNNYVASVNPKSTEWYKYDDESMCEIGSQFSEH
jgi:hypothetical protein